MSFFLNIRANYLATIVEVCAEVVVVVVTILMGWNAAHERRKALYRSGKVENAMRYNSGSFMEQLSVIFGKQWTRFGRIIGTVVAVLFILSFVIGPVFQSQIIGDSVTDERFVPYRRVEAVSFCRGPDQFFKSEEDRSISQTFDYATRHGIELIRLGVAPRLLDVEREESIYPRGNNNGTRIEIVSDETKLMTAGIDDNQVLWRIFDGSVDLFEAWVKSDFVQTNRNFQKVRTTFFKGGGKWKARDAEGMVGVFFRDHVEYKIVLVDTKAIRDLPQGSFQVPVRIVDVSFSEATPWPEGFQDLLRLRLHRVEIQDKEVVRVAAFVLALHWASMKGTECKRDMYIPINASRVSNWAVYWGLAYLGTLAVLLLLAILTMLATRKMPDFLDDSHRALSSCFSEVNGLESSTTRTKVNVETVQVEEKCFRASWRKNSAMKVVPNLTKGLFLSGQGERTTLQRVITGR